MPARHVTDQHSAAYDGLLTAAEQQRYDEHLAACSACAAAAAELRQAVDAVRALPRAQMPQRVVLPATPPQPERRGVRLALPFSARLPALHLTPAWGAAVLTVAGIAVAVIAVRGHVGGPSVTSNAVSGSAARPPTAPNANRATAGIGTCPLPVALVPLPSAAPSPPPGFGNTTTATAPQRPGQQLVLATTTTHVSPGQQVLIYAALTTGGGQGQHTAVIPCVSLHDQGALAFASGEGQSAGGDQAGPAAGPGAAATSPSSSLGVSVPATSPQPATVPEQGAAVSGGSVDSAPGATLLSPAQVDSFAPYSLLPSLAVASPTAAAVANLPLQVLQIPGNVTPGTVLQLVALVPSGLPGSGDQPAVEAVLTLEVS